jgi:xanthine dehydrogenase YagS FAD-binding subunit
MDAFQFLRAESLSGAVQSGALSPTAQQGASVRFVAGGTNLIDMMKLNVERPKVVVDINGLPLDKVEATPEGGLRIGALARNSDVARHPTVMKDYAVLSPALLSGASPQLRNMATTGGNLLQRTRCVYFRDTAHACNKREAGSGCSAIGGYNRMLAVLGTSNDCIATNPSDQNVALTALEATIQIRGAKGERSVPIHDFYLLPGSTPQRETVLEPGDVITSVTLPPPMGRSLYLKLRDRAAYEFALASAAIVVKLNGNRIQQVRVAMGGVGAKPWRSFEAEKELTGHAPGAEVFRRAAEAALKDARPQSENGFKIELAKRCVVRALTLSVKSA